MSSLLAFMCTGSGGCNDVVFTFFIALPLAALAVIALVVTPVVVLLKKKRKPEGEQVPVLKTFGKMFGLIVAGALALVLVFVVIPTIVSDRKWENKQKDCAREAGYEHPWEDNSNKATAESQQIYGDCLRT